VHVLATPACPRSGGRPDLYSVGPGRHQQTGPAPRRWRAGGGGPSGARPQTRRADTPERWPLMEAFATPTHPTGGGSPDLHSVGPGPHQQTGPAPRRWRVWGMDPPAPSLDLFPKVPPYSGSVLATKESEASNGGGCAAKFEIHHHRKNSERNYAGEPFRVCSRGLLGQVTVVSPSCTRIHSSKARLLGPKSTPNDSYFDML